jgi:mRNA interferase MazF
VRDNYYPDRGHIVRINFDPQAGHEQMGRRPALVLSPISYNRRTSLALIVPITNQIKGYPFEVTLPGDCPTTGVILSDQIKNLDWVVRNADFICTVTPEIVDDVIAKVRTLLD